jgi:hypothetical protein
MAQAIIQQQPVDGDFDDAVDPESDISGDDSGMETDEDDNVKSIDFGHMCPSGRVDMDTCVPPAARGLMPLSAIFQLYRCDQFY